MPLTKLNNKAVANITSLPVALGDMVLVSSATASSSASIEFTLGDYKEYKFFFVNIHPQNDQIDFQMNFSTDSGSNYNVTKTTTAFRAFHNELGNDTNFSYHTGEDLAQGTGFQSIAYEMDNANDMAIGGVMSVFNPSSTTYVKHFICQTSSNLDGGASFGIYNLNFFTAGYANTTSALTNIKFQMSSGNIDAGTILMYGLN